MVIAASIPIAKIKNTGIYKNKQLEYTNMIFLCIVSVNPVLKNAPYAHAAVNYL